MLFQDQIQLALNKQEASITKATLKKVYREKLSLHRQLTQSLMKASVASVWTVHSLLVALDTKSQEFQHKIINKYLVTNTFLKKIGNIDSSLCTFCGMLDESLEHLHFHFLLHHVRQSIMEHIYHESSYKGLLQL